jgi:hypothetical protein
VIQQISLKKGRKANIVNRSTTAKNAESILATAETIE